MNAAAETPVCEMSLSELLLHALVIELEAMQRYTQLAEMMELTGNKKVANIFAKMSQIEATHAEIIEEQIKGRNLPMLTPSQYHWRGPEAPENTDSARLFHLMTPYQAMSLALDNEKRAFEFFEDVVNDSTDERVREMAAEFAVEEEQHVAWVEEWLAEELARH
jgi:rubrerythrin